MIPPRKLLYVSSQACPAQLQDHLRRRHWEWVQARSLKAASPLLRQQEILVGLLDLQDPTRDVAAELDACRQAGELCEWVALVPPGAMEVPALRELVLGHCFDHHTHPADPQFLCQSLGHAYGRAVLRARAFASGATDELGLVGRSTAMAQLRRFVRKAAAASVPVLVEGEVGAGKEQVARALHACSPRAGGPFIVLDASAAPTEAGGLFEAAAGGTLFVDRACELPLALQARLLRFLVETAALRTRQRGDPAGPARVVAASATPLADCVAARRFRQDLYYRLHVLAVTVPPLRERREDIPLLAQHFRARCIREEAGGATGFSRHALDALAAHDWPGNVRELENRVRRAVLLAQRRLIVAQDLGLDGLAPGPLESLEKTRVRAERDAIALSLERFSHNVSLAARELGISRMTLYRLMAKHAIAPKAGAAVPAAR